MSSGETLPLHKEDKKSTFVLVHITGISRTWGLITVITMWACAIFMINDHQRGFIVFYLIGISILVTFLEITWVLNKLACCGQQGCCCRIWRAIMWIDNWKKFLLYVGVSVPLFLEGKREALGIVTGFMLIILSTLYLVKTFQSGQVSFSYSHSRTERTEFRRQVVTHENGTQMDRDEYPDRMP